MDQWTYRDLIDLYIDGELPVEQQAVLFSALASSQELQSEFHQALAIRLAARRQAQELVPPPALTARILSAAAVPATTGSLVQRVWNVAVARIALAVVGAAVIGFVVGQWFAPTQQATTSTNSAPVTQHSTSIPPSVPLPSSTQQRTALQQTVPTVTHSTETRDTYTSVSSDALAEQPPALKVIEPVALPFAQLHDASAEHMSTVPIESSAHQVPHSPMFIIPAEPDRPSVVVLSIRRTSTIMLRQSELAQPSTTTPLANTIAALEYRQRNVGLVLQAGYEQFPLYQVTRAQDGSPRYSLQQQLWWVGGGMRVYVPNEHNNMLLRSLRPVAGIMLGSSAYGVLGRAELGFVWEPLPQVGVQWLLEGMVHSHSIGTGWEHAEKLSTSLGLSFRF